MISVASLRLKFALFLMIFKCFMYGYFNTIHVFILKNKTTIVYFHSYGCIGLMKEASEGMNGNSIN
jgi:hypothetical protein